MKVDLIDLAIEIANGTMGYHGGNMQYGCNFCRRMYSRIGNDPFPQIGSDAELTFHIENCPGLKSVKIARKYGTVKNVAKYPATQTILRYVRTLKSRKKPVEI